MRHYLLIGLLSLAYGQPRPALFFNTLHPMICQANQRIQKERACLSLAHHTHMHSPCLIALSKRYQRPLPHTPTQWQTLYRRVNTLPPSLIMAQAALESGFGQARLARESHNYFGLWCYTPGCGIVPMKRNKNQHHAIKSFPSILAGMEAYLLNLNTHPAYRTLRQLRYDKPTSSSEQLAATLNHYAAIGAAYPQRLRALIHRYHLRQYDNTSCPH